MKQPGTQYDLFALMEASRVEPPGAARANAQAFSDFVVYVDESGDHSLDSINPQYPVFVLALCVFHKRHYAEKIVPAVEKLKFNYFGHDSVVLHEHEIRKQTDEFAFLTHRPTREAFMEQLDSVMAESNFVLIACVVDKLRLTKDGVDTNPYNLALGVCLDALHDFVREKGQAKLKTHVLVECRGKKEDAELELEFRRICDGANSQGANLPFDVVFADKKTNLAGLQFADLVARPIGIHYLRPTQRNHAYDVLRQKFLCAGGRKSVGRDFEGVGLLVLPPQKAKSPGDPTEAIAPIGNPQST
jgi:hypothetical protein